MDSVVLLDAAGNANGCAAKLSVHDTDTPLHLAFSCYVFDDRGRFLITRRAESKKTWPGVWSNSCCGHPRPEERIDEAVHRRLRAELGVAVADLTLALPRFRYQARMTNGVVENEMCPVFLARVSDGSDIPGDRGDPGDRVTVRPDPAEVADVEWADWPRFRDDVTDGRRAVSPWCALQVRELAELGPDPFGWPAADPAELPPAARR